ncbi:zf-TFIIB domain-containing protein [[Clostridium] hylemonae]|nr:zf-TFIIB domain-containing protein [[Clostridium] hylemonae]MCB7520897.1 zf-TFIIB domain-containing protein [[Clostridium] hylemonae]QEK18160.1 hypothetical protein LAJLEIBI_02176 [[Clostridium] hylemonae DSM 15053]BDF05174.1 hypothetical protein CE91St63_22360 [[Clostridium] hylemonae]
MKCPKCGQPLKPSQKDPDYMLCFNCRKKFRVSGAKQQKEEEEEQRYANIPPKKVRDKREKEMRRAYDELLSVDDERPRKRPKKRPEPEDEDDYYDLEDDKVSKVPVIILGIAIVAVAALIIYMFLK